MLALLRRPAIALVWSGLALSALGDQLYAVALGWVAADAFGSAAGYISAVRSAITLLTALLSGVVADGWDRQRTMVGADLARFAAMALVVAVWSAQGHPSALLLAAAVAVLAAGEAFFQPALQTLLPGLLAREAALLVAANGLLDATSRLARLLGPGLIALAGAVLAPIHVFGMNAASFLLSALAISSLRPAKDGSLAIRGDRRPIESMIRGFAVMHRDRLLGYLLQASGPLNGAWTVVFYLAVPLTITDRFGISDASGFGFYGLVISAYGVCNLGANLIVGNRSLPENPANLCLAGFLLTGSGILLMGAACLPGVPDALQMPGFVMAAAISGAGGPLKDIPFATLRQLRVPLADIGAGTRAYLVATHAWTFVALLAAPWACRTLGTTAVMLLTGVLYYVMVGVGWLRIGRGRES